MDPIDAVFQSMHENEAYAKGSATRILRFLRELELDTAEKLAARIARLSEKDKTNFINGRYRGQYSTERLERLLESIREMSKEWRQITEDNIKLSAKEIAAAQIGFQSEALSLAGVLGEGISINAAVSAAYAQPLLAKPLREYFKDQESNVRRTITDSIRRSFVAGETVEQTVDSLIGTKAFNFEDGDIKKHRAGVRMIARTALNHVSVVTTMETFRALNVQHWRYLSVLDGRTSTICQGLSGTRWKVSNRNAPYPPRHPGCRSLPIFDDEPIEGEQSSNMATVGPVDAKLTYEQILKRQPIEWQREQFTALQWRLWRSGKVKLRGFSDTKSTRELTDGELRVRYSSIISQLGQQRAA